MDLQEYLETVIAFLKTNPLLAGAIALLLLFFLRRYPKGFLKLTVLLLLVAGGIQLMSHVVSTGNDFQKHSYEASTKHLPADE